MERQVAETTGSVPTLGFIGLGVMGSGMCANAVKKHDAPLQRKR